MSTISARVEVPSQGETVEARFESEEEKGLGKKEIWNKAAGDTQSSQLQYKWRVLDREANFWKSSEFVDCDETVSEESRLNQIQSTVGKIWWLDVGEPPI
jgi:hypothetical protein